MRIQNVPKCNVFHSFLLDSNCSLKHMLFRTSDFPAEYFSHLLWSFSTIGNVSKCTPKIIKSLFGTMNSPMYQLAESSELFQTNIWISSMQKLNSVWWQHQVYSDILRRGAEFRSSCCLSVLLHSLYSRLWGLIQLPLQTLGFPAPATCWCLLSASCWGRDRFHTM